MHTRRLACFAAVGVARTRCRRVVEAWVQAAAKIPQERPPLGFEFWGLRGMAGDHPGDLGVDPRVGRQRERHQAHVGRVEFGRDQAQSLTPPDLVDLALDHLASLVLMRHDQMWGVGLAFAAIAGSFLVSYARARAEALGLRGDVGLGSRAERVVVITTGLVLAPVHDLVLPATMALLATTAWITVVQRILFVRKQLQTRP